MCPSKHGPLRNERYRLMRLADGPRRVGSLKPTTDLYGASGQRVNKNIYYCKLRTKEIFYFKKKKKTTLYKQLKGQKLKIRKGGMIHLFVSDIVHWVGQSAAAGTHYLCQHLELIRYGPHSSN